jgi:hypothetical protein
MRCSEPFSCRRSPSDARPVQALLATARGRKLRARIARALPEDQQFLLDLKAADVRDIPQVKQPQRHLSEAGKRGGVTSAPNLPGDESTTQAPEKAPRRKE